MKKVFIFLSVAFTLFVVIVITGIIFIGFKANALYKGSQEYVDAAIPAIVSEWDKQELMNRASPEFMDSVQEYELNKLFSKYQGLGNLREYKSAERKARGFSFSSGRDGTISVDYVAKVQFDSGSAEIKVSLIKHSGNWQIFKFQVNSKAFPTEI
ncbi:hypothetical protein H8E77_15030 [bacterium]|nr:hypothetical protein [bacterium]